MTGYTVDFQNNQLALSTTTNITNSTTTTTSSTTTTHYQPSQNLLY